MARSVRIAIEGCGHGTLDAIYASVTKSCEVKGWDGVDALIIGGDFQAVRNGTDLNAMAVPMKYRELGDFHKYYSGERTAPYLTLFVGGNHEASNHLWELYYGGWVAPNIYYMGAANVLRLGPLRIAGLSGIWKGYDYRKPHFERIPYNSSDVRSIFHVRELDVRKLLQIRTQVDVGVSHDWPNGIEWLGDHGRLFSRKQYFLEDARSGKLGSPAGRYVLDWLRPKHWYSAHLHVKYAAVVEHDKPDTEKAVPADEAVNGTVSNGVAIASNEDEIALDMDDDADTNVDIAKPIRNADEVDLDDDIDTAPEASASEIKHEVQEHLNNKNEIASVDADLRAQLPAAFQKPAPVPSEPDPPHTITNTTTRFLALDKCLPNRDFLQLFEIEASPSDANPELPDRPYQLSYDPEWLAITRAFALHEPLQLGDPDVSVPRAQSRAHYSRLIDESGSWISSNLSAPSALIVPTNFATTAPVYDADEPIKTLSCLKEYDSPQTQIYCDLIGIENRFFATGAERDARVQAGERPEEPRGGRFGRGGRGGRGGHRGGFRNGGRGIEEDRGRGRGRGRGTGRGRV